jgi:hypothetical protein
MSAHLKLRPEVGTAKSHNRIEKGPAAIRQRNVTH